MTLRIARSIVLIVTIANTAFYAFGMCAVSGNEGFSSLKGRVVLWPAMSQADTLALVTISPEGRWVALHDGQGQMRIWECNKSLALQRMCLDTRGKGFVVKEFAWARDSILYSRINGVPDQSALDAMQDVRAYVVLHSQTVQWNPASGHERVLFPYLIWGMLPDRRADQVALFNADVDLSKLAPGVARVRVLHMPQAKIKNPFFDVRFGPAGRFPSGNSTYPLCWSRDSQCFFLVGMAPGPDPYDSKKTMLYPSLLVAGPTTPVKQLLPTTVEVGGNTLSLLPQSGRWSLPWITPLKHGADLAMLLQDNHPGQISIVYLTCDGLLRRHQVHSASWPEPWKDMWVKGPRPNIISLTPDGEHILFQDRSDEHMEDGRKVFPLYLWRIDGGDALRIGWAPEITAVFDWVDDRFLPFSAPGKVEWKGKWGHQFQEYGSIVLTNSAN